MADLGVKFPSFLPPEASHLKEQAARIMASRIKRLPVTTELSASPILTSCVTPGVIRSNASPLLLLHGFDSSCLEWRRAFPLLEDAGLEPWAVDILGWGFSSSERKISSYGAKAKTRHLYDFWRSHIRRPAIVVGPSLGGAAAIELAATYPEMVSKLVLIDAQGYAEGLGNLTTSPRSLLYAGAAVLKSVPLRAYANLLIFKGLNYSSLMDLIRVGRLHCLMPGWADALVDFMISGGYNVVSQIPQVDKETLLIWGERDTIVPTFNAEKFLVDLPNSRLEIISDCGHIPHVERPTAVADSLSRFLKVTSGHADGADLASAGTSSLSVSL
ncbi:hypothetical protein SELMODRAFT_403595 [Selaginella moellendorffii]|uniref:AB hydrolase-1 domain-containing protein n=1 Tax=Selaginella moellendorffii TaxID=88036 RepID=D8QRW9_SELML|nr:hypothetical protein SELMODRAFT_403595 [Selaginella moellendorffii]